ncbi:hypothetical protein F2P56_011417 [Juglans regia]|uniref:Uncharacterized protein LOC109009018 n=2 Tax=Juglans regia TaxID=51240 RepID=A0A2I4GLW2_JUGRE|nr:uncharacterized protein LOC109009018 [Juglans regia]KAF5470931.1 hypothetical protein F2P56_011417 [Juglans regia]
MFGKAKVEGLTASSLDHHPFMPYVRKDSRFVSKRQHSFKFEASWIREDECEELIRTAWTDTPQIGMEPLVCVHNMLRVCSSKLSSTFRRRDVERCHDIEKLNKRIKELQDREGPNNSAKLHMLQQKRRKNNQITLVVDANSYLKEGNEEVVEAFRQYYTEVYKTIAPSCNQVTKGVQSIRIQVIEQMNEELEKPFTRNEVLATLKQMGPLKAPGPNGFEACFYQTYWHTVGDKRMRFRERWIGLIMECITSVSYVVLVNGRPRDVIYPSQGIRQGDPISPYLFLLSADGLSSLINVAKVKGDIRGMTVARGGIKVSHILFADDSIIFARAKWLEWLKVKEILRVYEVASGQCMNLQKTTMMFSSPVRQEEKERILQDLREMVQSSCEKYLGLPIMVGRACYDTFRRIKDRVWHKINNWKNQFLSPAGKKILLKEVIQYIPTYCMSVFRLPKSWEKMGFAKMVGGLGFRELESFNTALLAKQCWRLVTKPNSITTMEGLVWRVGNGLNIKVWEDKWLPSKPSHRVQSPIKHLNAKAKVVELLGNGGNWDIEVVKATFNEEEAEVICNIRFNHTGLEDKRIWAYSKNGCFNVRSTYHLELSRKKELKGESSEGESLKKGGESCGSLIPRE